jgi:hypothetical protein
MTNILTAEDSSFEGGTTGSFGVVNATLANNSTNAAVGTHSLAVTCTNASSPWTITSQSYVVTPGVTYQLSAQSQATSVVRDLLLGVTWLNGATFVANSATVAIHNTGWASGSINLVCPAGANRARVTVTSPIIPNGEVHWLDNFVLQAISPPAVTSITPTGGLTTGGTQVTISGSNLTGITGVTFGGIQGNSLVVVNDTTATVYAPVSTITGSVDVIVSNAFASVTLPQAFTYSLPVNPHLYCSSPAVLTLTLGSLSLDFMDALDGWRVSEVDISYPDVREDSDLAADRHGTVDYTRLFGARAITISGSIVPSSRGSRQKALRWLGQFLTPSSRPMLTYQIDTDVSPRQVTVRPSALTAPYNDRNVSAFTLGFKCPDPVAYDSTTQTVYAGLQSAGGGRAYNLTFNRVYPASGAGAASARNNGNMTSFPLLRLYGPVAALNGAIYIRESWTGNPVGATLPFRSDMIINAGDYLEIDCRARTAFLNGQTTQNWYSQLGAIQTVWPQLPPGVDTLWWIYATGTNATMLQVNWQDAYLI